VVAVVVVPTDLLVREVVEEAIRIVTLPVTTKIDVVVIVEEIVKVAEIVILHVVIVIDVVEEIVTRHVVMGVTVKVVEEEAHTDHHKEMVATDEITTTATAETEIVIILVRTDHHPNDGRI
jgi:hypothetical protein